jgi:DHA2 family multidrug resistance protein
LSTTTTTPTPFFHAPQRDSPLALRIAVTCVMVGMFMQMLDSTIANVALPYMQGSLQASRDQITWVLTSYIIASAIMTGPIG